MSKYYRIFWDLRQWRAILYRIYINIFGIFLRIPILPMSINHKSFWFWRRGEEIGYIFSWARRRGGRTYKFVSLDSWGEFNSLREIDEFWLSFQEECDKINND